MGVRVAWPKARLEPQNFWSAFYPQQSLGKTEKRADYSLKT
ncbi:hypothetical protein [Moorena sp. SIO3B2]|nr:hypothetical protein [Moorena sp. SIO3B2]